MNRLKNNPFMRKPDYPNYKKRAAHHDYRRPGKYMITFLKNPAIPAFAKIEGDPHIREGEHAPHSIITPTGKFILEAIKIWLEKFPQIELAQFAIMPGHIHLCVHVKDYLPNGLSLAMSSLKGKASSLRHVALPENLRPEKLVSLFEEGFNDRISYDDEQWERQKNYIIENPRRYLIKKLYPDYMLRRWVLKIGNDEFIAKGNIMLLKEPELFVAKHHRSWSEAESEDYQKECRQKIDNGHIPVSPFIHPKEKDIRNYAVNEGCCYIRICENGIAERQSASGFEFDMMATGRLLLIAPLEHNSRKTDLKYVYAKRLNAISSQIVALHNSGSATSIRNP